MELQVEAVETYFPRLRDCLLKLISLKIKQVTKEITYQSKL